MESPAWHISGDPTALESFLGIAAAGGASSANSNLSRPVAAPVPVSTQHFVLTPISHSPHALPANISVNCPTSQTVVSTSQSQSFICTPVKSSSSSSGIAVVASSIAFGHSEAVISSSNISFSDSSNNLCLETSGIQIGSSRMPSGPSGAPVGPPALARAVSASSNISGSSSIATVLNNSNIPVGSSGVSNILVGPPGTVFTSANLSLSQMTVPQSTTASPSSPFSVPTRSPHAPPTPSPSPLPRRSPAPQHPPSPAPSPYHVQLQSPQNSAATATAGFVLSATAPPANVKDIITSLPILQPPSLKTVQGSNINAPLAASNYSVGNSVKEGFRSVHQQTSTVVLPQRLSAAAANSLQSPQSANSPPSVQSFVNLQTPQPVLISQSASLQACPGSQVLTHGAKNSSPVGPVTSGSGPLTPAGALTPAPSPSPQHRTVHSPVIRSTTPTPVIHQALPAGLAIPGAQQFPAVMSQGGTAVLQTTNHQLVQIIHQSAAVQGTSFPAHTQIITTGGAAAPVHLHSAAAAAAANAGAAAAAAKTKQPPQILPKPPGTSSLTAATGHVKIPNVGTPPHQGLHTQNHSTGGTQVVIGQTNQAAMIPTAQGGTLLLNQVLRLVAAQGTVQLQSIQTPNGPTLIAVPPGSALSFQPVSQLTSPQQPQTQSQQTSKLTNQHVSIQTSNTILPAVLNNIQQSFQQNASRTSIQNNAAVTNLNLNVHNLSLNVTNTNSATCSHTSDILGDSSSSCQSCSASQQPAHSSNIVSESPVNVNLNVNASESSSKRTSPSGLHNTPEIAKENIETINVRESNGNQMVAPTPLPLNRKKSKKKKKKNKLDLANIMKLSGIGDDDDIAMYESEEQPIASSAVGHVHAVEQLQSDTTTQSPQMLNSIPSAQQIPMQANGQASLRVSLEDCQVVFQPTSETQQNSPSASPHLVSTGTNTIMTQPSSVSSSNLPTSQVNPVHFMTASYSSGTSQNTRTSQSENYQLPAKQTDSCVSGLYSEPSVRNQRGRDISSEVGGNIDVTAINSASNPVTCDGIRNKSSGNELKDIFAGVSVTDQSAISDKLVNSLPSNMNVIVADAINTVIPAVTTSTNTLNSATREVSSVQSAQPVGKSTQVLCTAVTPSNISNRNSQNESVSILIGGNPAISPSSFISHSVMPASRNCLALDSSKCTNGEVSKQIVAATCDKAVSANPPGIFSSVSHSATTSGERVATGNAATTQTENVDVVSTSSGNTLIGSHLQLQSSQQPVTKVSDRQSTFLPVSSASSTQNTCSAPKNFPSVDNAPTFLGLHAFHSLQGLVSSATPLMATIPPITSNAASTNSSYGGPLTYTGAEPLVIAHHQSGLPSVITGPQLLQCLQQTQGQQTGLINMSHLQLTQNAISKVIGSSTSSLSFNAGTGTILIGGNPVENFTNTNQPKSSSTAAAVISSAKFIPQPSVLLQQLNTGLRRCSSDSNSSLSLGSPPSVIGLISQQTASQTEQTGSQPIKKGPTQESIETQTVSVGVQNSNSSNSNSLAGFQNTVLESASHTNNNILMNKFTKSVQYNSISNVSPSVSSSKKKKKQRYDRTPPKTITCVSAAGIPSNNTSSSTNCMRNTAQQVENANRVLLSVDPSRCVVQDRSTVKSCGSHPLVQSQNFQKLSTEPVSSSSTPSYVVSSPQFNVTSNIRAAVVSTLTSPSLSVQPEPSHHSTGLCQQSNISPSSNIIHRNVSPANVMSNVNKNILQQTNLIPTSNVNKGSNHFTSSQETRNSASHQVPSIVQTSLSTNSLMISNQPEILQVSSSSVTVISNGITSTSEITQRKQGDSQHAVVQVNNSQQTTNSLQTSNSTPGQSPVKFVAIQDEHQQAPATQNANPITCSIGNPQQTLNNHLASNNVSPSVPHLVPIPSNAIAVHPGSHGLQIQAAGNTGSHGLLPGSIIQKVHTIQLTPQNQKVGTQTCMPPEEYPQNSVHMSNRTPCNVSPNGQQCTATTFLPLNNNKNVLPSSGKILPNHSSTALKSIPNAVFTNGSKSHTLPCAGASKPQMNSSPASPPRGTKRSATSPLRSISRSDLIEHQLKTDQTEASLPDVQTPFSSSHDACKRLIRYHVYNEKVLSQKDLEKADEIFEATAKHLLDKFRQMMNKYNYLLLMESMREVNTSELIMIDRMFVAEEHNILEKLKEEEQRAKEEPVTADATALKTEPSVDTQSCRYLNSDLADIRDVRVVIQDVMKNESIKRELEEDKFTVIKKEKLDFDEDSDEAMPMEQPTPAVVPKVDQNYDEWEEIQKELGVFCPTSQSSCTLQEATVVVKSEENENVDSCCRHIKMESDDMSHGLKNVDQLNCRTAGYNRTHDSVQNISTNVLKCEPTTDNIDTVHKSCDSAANGELCDLYNHHITKTVSSDTQVADDRHWEKKFAVASGGLKSKGSREGGSGESEPLKYLSVVNNLSSDVEVQKKDRRDICDTIDTTKSFVHKRKRHKHDTHFVSECIEELPNVIRGNRSFCESDQENEEEEEEEEENDALNAQVQSAIDSILNLQRSEDGYEITSASVSAVSDECVLNLPVDVNSEELDHKYSRKVSEDNLFSEERSTKLLKCQKRTTASIVNSCGSSPVPIEYGDETDPFISRNSTIVITNGGGIDEDSSGNGDAALDEAVRSILTS